MHPYSQALLSAIPIPDCHKKMQRVKLIGELQSPIDPKPGCRFAKRCIYSDSSCIIQDPKLIDYGNRHYCACFKEGQLNNIKELI